MHRNGLDLTNTGSHSRGSGIRKADVILISAFLFIALAGFLLLTAGKKEGQNVLVIVDGTLTGTYSLAQDKEIRIDGDGGTNVLEIRNGQADMTDAGCPDQICVHHAPISKVGESIICLPNKVVVKIVSDDEESETPVYDVITH